jgi:uncharacterized protein
MIEVREGRLGLGVYATRPIDAGALIVVGHPRPCPAGRTRHSVQIDHDAHVVFGPPVESFNHSCDPNCGILLSRDGGPAEVRAMRPVAEGEELTFDYAAFEDDIQHMPCPCLCGSRRCRGKISGYHALPTDRREAYGVYIAEYLREADPARAEVAVELDASTV